MATPKQLRRRTHWGGLLLVAALALFAFAGGAFAVTDDTGTTPSITSNQSDYSPGATVTLTGSGWQGDDSVALMVNDSIGASWSWSDTVTPDSDGNFTDTLTLPNSFVATYSVTATGSPSGTVATTSFTDSSTAVAAAPTGVSFSLTYQGFDDSGCTTPHSGTPGTEQTTTVTAGTNFSLTSSNYFKLTAGSASAPSGATFSSWGASGGGSFSGTTNVICAVAATASNNYLYTATYSTVQATSLSAVSGSGTYGGTATLTATLMAGATPLNGKSVSFTLNGISVGSANTNPSGVATLSGVSLSGYNAGTYTNYVGASFAGGTGYGASGPTYGNLTVNKAHLTVTADDQTITYGDPAPSPLTATISGFVNSETLATSGVTGSASCSLKTPVPTDAGTYTDEIVCTVGTLSATNYDFPAANFLDGTYTINKKLLTVTADNQTAQYSDATPPLTFTYSGGFVGSDTASDIDTPPTCHTDRLVTDAAGTARQTGCGGGLDNNYSFTYVRGTFTITKEDATVAFDSGNPDSQQVDSPGSGSYTGGLSLKITVKEKTPDLPTLYALAGDISKAGLVANLSPLGGGGSITLTCDSGTSNNLTGYAQIIAFNCSTTAAIPVGAYEVDANVPSSNTYYTGSGMDAFTVYDPSLGFATGGGWFLLSGDKVNFGFTMKYGKNGSNLKGNFIAVRHYPDGTTERLKSNTLDSGSLAITNNGGCGQASFSGKATYTDQSGTTTGNNPFIVYAQDCNNPGTGVDSIWLSGTGGLTITGPASTNLVTLGGGNIAVPHTTGKK